jgi:c-di-GMP-related signal transduction protein
LRKFVARQPVLDREKRVFGYELLFRSGVDNFFSSDQPDMASTSVMSDSFLLFGIDTITGGLRAFLNFTRNLLVQEYAFLMPPGQVVVEVLEDVKPEPEILSACAELKKRGYMIALDDFVVAGEASPLVGFADIIKIDFLTTQSELRRKIVHQFQPRGIRMLAEKVENYEHFREALDNGYEYFQGYFFCKPEILTGKDIRGLKLNYLNLLQAVSGPEPDFLELERIIKHDTSLCYKLLRYLNSAVFALHGEINSIRHALSLLGIQEVRRWTSLVALSGLLSDKPAELMITSMVRARFCENLSRPSGQAGRSTELFLLGLLSMMDAFLDRPMTQILEAIPISAEIKAALLGHDNSMHEVLSLVLAHEKGDWDLVAAVSDRLKLGEAEISRAYVECVSWTHNIFQMNIHSATKTVQKPGLKPTMRTVPAVGTRSSHS